MDSFVGWHAVEAVGELELRSLATLRKGARGTVSAVNTAAAAGANIGDEAGSTLARRLIELGFVPGERIEVIGESRPGRDPIAVRIGSSMFALRRREAHAVLVQIERRETP